MEFIGSLFLVAALALIVVLFIAQPFFRREEKRNEVTLTAEQERDHLRSSLMAERDRVLEALHELDFDYALGKIPPEDYPFQRQALLKSGADVLRHLDALQPQAAGLVASAEDRIEAVVAARRQDATARVGAPVKAASGNGAAREKDALEDIIAARKRQRQESSGGFCPRCGKPVSKSDKFCSKCGATL